MNSWKGSTLLQNPQSLWRQATAATLIVMLSGGGIAAAAKPKPTRVPPGHTVVAPPLPQLLAFTSPSIGANVSGGDVTVKIKLATEEDPTTLKVVLNGHDISPNMDADDCDEDSCEITGTVDMGDGLKQGHNSLFASVAGKDDGVGAVQKTSFNYGVNYSASSGASTTNFDPASVGLYTAVQRDGNASPIVQITTGYSSGVSDPTSTFPNVGSSVSLPYQNSSTNPNCSSILWAVDLNRTAPSQVTASVCGSSISDIQSKLASAVGRSLGTQDLVIMGTTPGNNLPAGTDASPLGGTDFTKVSSYLYPQEYMMIGVPGTAAGQAHESYNVLASATSPRQYWPFLQGSLLVDQNGDYNYVPSDQRTFSIVSAPGWPVVTIGSQQYMAPAGATEGGIWIMAVDRELLQPVDLNVNDGLLATSSGCPYDGGYGTPAYCGTFFKPAMDNGALLASTLAAISPRDIVFMATNNCLFSNESQPEQYLGDVMAYWGMPSHLLKQLVYGGSAGTCNTSFVSVNDGKHGNALTTPAALSTTAYSAQNQKGIITGLLARDNSGLYDIKGKDVTATSTTSPTIDYTFQQVASQQRSDWPLTDTSSRLAAYHDISYQLMTDGQVDKSGSYIYDVRYFYTDSATAGNLVKIIDARLGPSANNPVVQSPTDTATAADFAAVRTELYNELRNLNSVSGYLNQVSGALNSSTASLYSAMTSAAATITNDNTAAQQLNMDGTYSNYTNLLAGMFSAFGAVIPEVGPFIGVISGSLWTGSAAAAFGGANSIAGNPYYVTLNNLTNNANSTISALQTGFAGAEDAIYSDSQKLSQVAAQTSDSDGTWSFSNMTKQQTLQTYFTSAATAKIWLDVLPSLYGVRVAYATVHTDPSQLKAGDGTDQHGNLFCASAYGLKTPAVDLLVQQSFSDTSRNDLWMLGESPTVKNNFETAVKDAPMSQDLATNLLTWNNGAGMNFGPLLLSEASPLSTGDFAFMDQKTISKCGY